MKLIAVALVALVVLGCSTAYAEEPRQIQDVEYEAGLHGSQPYLRVSWDAPADLAGGIALEIYDEDGRTRFYDKFCWNCDILWVWSSRTDRYERYGDDLYHLKQAGCELGDNHVELTAGCLERFKKPIWSWQREFPSGFLSPGTEYEIRLYHSVNDRYYPVAFVTIPEKLIVSTAVPVPTEQPCYQRATWREAVKCLEDRMNERR